jgi:hypothetical protein
MQLIFGNHNANLLQEKHTVVFLENQIVKDQDLAIWCLIPPEQVCLDSIQEELVALNYFTQSVQHNRGQMVRDMLPTMRGMFGGELDSFFDSMAQRFAAMDITA